MSTPRLGNGQSLAPGVPHASATIQAKAMAMIAGGLTQAEVARSLGVSRETVSRWAKSQENATLVQTIRDELRVKTIEGVAKSQPKLGEWLDDLVTKKAKGTARDVDALARAAAALEKTAASAAGEHLGQGGGKVEVVVRLEAWVPSGQNPDYVDALPVV